MNPHSDGAFPLLASLFATMRLRTHSGLVVCSLLGVVAIGCGGPATTGQPASQAEPSTTIETTSSEPTVATPNAAPADNIVFDLKFVEFLADGRPVVEVKANGKPRPDGAGPYGDYYLILRPGESTPYTRQFDKEAAEKGARRDFMVTKDQLAEFSKVTVSVENPVGGKFDNATLLSNKVEIPVK